MTVDLPLLLLGLLLLFFPRQWMRIGASVGPHRRRNPQREAEPWLQREPGDPRVSFRREFTKLRNYFDLLRSAVGGLAIIGGLGIPASITIADSMVRVTGWQLWAIKLGILAAGVLIQTLRYERHRFGFFAPIFYLAGLTVSLSSLWGAVFAFILIWAINPMLPDAQAFLFVYGLVATAFGLLFHEVPRVLAVAAFFFCFLPVLLSLLARRPLVVFSRKAVRVVA